MNNLWFILSIISWCLFRSFYRKSSCEAKQINLYLFETIARFTRLFQCCSKNIFRWYSVINRIWCISCHYGRWMCDRWKKCLLNRTTGLLTNWSWWTLMKDEENKWNKKENIIKANLSKKCFQSFHHSSKINWMYIRPKPFR